MSLQPIKISFRNKKVTATEKSPSNERTKSVCVESVIDQFGKLKIESKKSIAYNEFNSSFSKFECEINQLRLPNQKQTNDVIILVKHLLENQLKMTKTLLETDTNLSSESKTNVYEILDDVNAHVNQQLSAIGTVYKRKKRLDMNPFYVPPQEKGLGIRWRSKIQPDVDVPNHVLSQTTFQIVPIKGTLLACFKRPSFKKIYFDYQNKKHQCSDGVYKNYCCSNVFRISGVNQHKDAIIIQIGTDDFDVCCPLKSKSTIHKLTAIYFTIRNLPPEYQSKLNCIFLVALCETENTKGRDVSLHDIWKLVQQELSELETIGLQIDENTNLKVFLFNVVSDNLGANGALGFVESFIVYGMCRICSMAEREWRFATSENQMKLRTESSYMQAINYIKSLDDDSTIDLKISQGIKSYCVLNDLDHFHVTKNINVDLMHDVLEGVVPFFLHNFFTYCHDNKIASYTTSQKLVRDFNYGFLFKQKLPSTIKTTSTHLNQNAIQLYTIMLHLPFIFKDYITKLGAVIECMELLLQIMQVLFSTTILKSDCIRLQMQIEMYLIRYQQVFKCHLLPKLHFLLHYPHVIQEMGPVVFTWMMRFESKHKMMASFGKGQNFKNIALTIAEQHQKVMCKDPFSGRLFEESQRKKFRESPNYNLYEKLIDSSDFDSNEIYSLKFLNYNHFQYRKGLFLIENYVVFEILDILFCEGYYAFICQQYDVICFDSFFNSIQIYPKNDSFVFITLASLENKQSYQKLNALGKMYIIADTLNVFRPE